MNNIDKLIDGVLEVDFVFSEWDGYFCAFCQAKMSIKENVINKHKPDCIYLLAKQMREERDIVKTAERLKEDNNNETDNKI